MTQGLFDPSEVSVYGWRCLCLEVNWCVEVKWCVCGGTMVCVCEGTSVCVWKYNGVCVALQVCVEAHECVGVQVCVWKVQVRVCVCGSTGACFSD